MRYTDKVENARKLITEYRLRDGDRTAVACSFGKDSMVVLHLALQVDPLFPVFSVMTPFKFKETLQYKDNMTALWNLNIRTYIEDRIQGAFDLNPDACCQRYKVEPTRKAIKDLGLVSWITGLRRTEGRTRTDYGFLENRGGNLLKINPILDFTELDVWRYLATNHIPVNPLYAEGYRSLGCEPCSKKEEDEAETEREGRWSGTSKCGGECGIHTQPLR
jgi:phosphoadenosine phosphosulfate reductase